jgi:hypothetical protein
MTRRPRVHRKDGILNRTVCGQMLAQVSAWTDEDADATCLKCEKEITFRRESGLYLKRENRPHA